MASFRALTLQSGKFKQQQDADTLIVGAGVATSTGAMGLDTGSGAAISIGGTTATSVDIGRVGQTTTVKGDLQVDGAETVTGSSTMNGNVVFGDAVTDTALFKARITSTGALGGIDLPFLKEEAHVIQVDTSTTANTAGGALTVSAGDGLGTGAGGALDLTGGAGTTSTGNGGAVTLDGGTSAGGTEGAITIGGTASGAITIGRAATFGMNYYVTPLDGGANVLLSSTAANATSGAAAIGVDGSSFTSIATADNDLQDILEALDGAIASAATTLQAAYEGGNTIGMTNAQGNFDVSQTSGNTSISLDAGADSNFNVAAAVAATPLTLTLGAANTGATSGDGTVAITASSTNGTGIIDMNADQIDAQVGASGTVNVATDAVASTVNVGTGAAAHTIAIGTGLAAQTVTVGSNNTTSSLLLESGSGGVGIDADGNSVWNVAGTLALDSTGTMSLGSVGASDWTNSTGNLTLATTTSGDVIASAAGVLNLDGATAVQIDAAAGGVSIDSLAGNSNFTVTNSTAATSVTNTLAVTNTGATSGDATLALQASSSNGTANITIGTNAAAQSIAIGNTTGATAVTLDAGTGGISLDTAVASNFTVSGATADLTLGARGSTITLNEAGDTSLDAGFTNTSIIGALNELLAGVGGSIFTLVTSQTAGEAVAVGNLVAIDDVAGTPKVFLADANGGTQLVNPIGFAQDAAVLNGALDVIVSGTIAVADSEWDSVPVVADVGKVVFMSTTPGNLTLTAPSTAGDIVQKVGVVSVGGTGAVEVIVQIGDGTEL